MINYSFFFLIFLLIALGAVLGSFLNVLIDRLSTGRSFVKGRSYCEHCKKTLHSIDLIPLLSYIALLGRCRYCKKRIPFRLFFVELFSALLLPCIYFYCIGNALNIGAIPFLFFALWAYIGIFFADFEYGIIPDFLVGISVVASLLYILIAAQPIVPHVLAGLGAFIFFLLLHVFTHGKGMGLGDVKLAFSMGMLLGFPLIVVSLYVAFLTGASVAIILVIWKKLRFFGGTIPFGPFLIFSSYFAFFLGNQIATTILRNYF